MLSCKANQIKQKSLLLTLTLMPGFPWTINHTATCSLQLLQVQGLRYSSSRVHNKKKTTISLTDKLDAIQELIIGKQ